MDDAPEESSNTVKLSDSDEDRAEEFDEINIEDMTELTGGYPRGGSIVSNVDGASGAVGAELAYLISKSIKNSQANRKLQEQEQEEPEQYIRYVHSRQPLNDYNDPEYFLGLFPTLFWNGRGGHMEE